jgi:uncharacterized Zn-binding protein involved in type VI secretion
MVPSPSGRTPTPLPHPFAGMINDKLSRSVNIMGMPAATVDSMATNTPSHIHTPPATSFQKSPSNKATLKMGNTTVNINGKPVARNGDTPETCNDPADAPVGKVIAVGMIIFG